MRKKGVEMSLNVIIIAAIGLLILVILAFLIINYVGKTQKGLESCTVKGGACQAGVCAVGHQTVANTDCKTPTPTCCEVLATT